MRETPTPADKSTAKPEARDKDAAFTGAQMASGSAWTLFSFAAAAVIRLGSSLVLTRAIPDAQSAYGVMALVYAFFGGLVMFSDFGLGQLLIQNPKGLTPEYRHTAFTVQAARGVAVWIIAMLIAPMLASIYPGYDGLQELLSVVALSAVIAGLGSTSIFTFKRRMQVAKLAKLELIAQVAGTSATIAHALLQPSAWAMVTGSLTSITVRTLISHLWNDERDRLRWNADAARQLKTVGRWVFVSTALTFLTNQADRLLFGQLITKEQLGIYAIAVVAPQTAQVLLQRLTINIIYPIYCQAARASGHLQDAFQTYGSSISISGGIILSCLVGGGDALMTLLYPDTFASGGWILRITAVGIWFRNGLGSPRTQALLAMALPKHTATANFVKVVAMCTLIPIGHMWSGFVGAVWAYAMSNVSFYITVVRLNRKVGISSFSNDVALSLRFAVTVGLASALDHYIQSLGATPLTRCTAVFVTACIAWLRPALASIRTLRDSNPSK